MKKTLNIRLLGLVISSLILSSSSCKKEDNVNPSTTNSTSNNSNDNFQVGGSISAEINGKMINYTNVEITKYGMSGDKGRITGVDSLTNQDTTYKLSVYISLVNTATGTFDEKSLKGHGVMFEEIENSSNDYYNYKSGPEYEINISSHKVLGERNDTTFYRIVGTFNFKGRVTNINKPYFNSVTVSNGSFNFIAFDWNGGGW